MAPYRIPFNKPGVVGNELAYIADAIQQGQIAGDGVYTRRCQRFLEDALGTPRAMLTTSCTDALEMAALLLDVQPEDEILVPSFTFVSTVNAFVLRGARPVFVDVRPDTLNLDETLVEDAITDKTKAIVPVHYAGVGCEMDRILAVAASHGVPVVEDNAHGLFGRYRDQHLGTFGSLAALSFQETKNIMCGEGGALLINDEALIDRAEVLGHKGTDRSRFSRGLVDKYTWVDLGSSFLPSDLLAAFLLAQLERQEHISTVRQRIWRTYEMGLGDWARSRGIQLPCVPPHCEQSHHMFYLVLPSPQQQRAVIDHLGQRGILATFHYAPLHSSAMGRTFGANPESCPVTTWASDRIVRLPFFYDLTENQQQGVIDAVMTAPVG